MNKKLLLILFALLSVSNLTAFDTSDGESFLGLTIENLFQAQAVPLDIRPQRGVEEDEDNVVFFYGSGFSLFLFKNRVWQVRYDRRATLLPYDLTIGESRRSILSRFLERELVPLVSGDDYVTFQLRDSPWPIRMSLYFDSDSLDDLYIYRSDF